MFFCQSDIFMLFICRIYFYIFDVLKIISKINKKSKHQIIKNNKDKMYSTIQTNTTIKGKGTTGYIQTNRINYQTQYKKEKIGSEYYPKRNKKEYKDQSLQEHELRRKIEVNIREYINKQYQSLSSEEKKLKLKEKRKEINDLINKEYQHQIDSYNDNYHQNEKRRNERYKKNHFSKPSLLDILTTFTHLEIK